MDNLLDAWDAAKRAPEPEVQARKSAGDIAIDVVTGREEFREAGRRIEEGDVASGLGLGAFTAATFVLPWGKGGRLAMRGARGLPGVRAARGLGDDFSEFWSPPPAGEPARSVGELSSEALDVLRSAGVEPAEASVLADSVFRLRQEVADTGGFTWDPRSGRVSFDEGYATAVVKGYERPIPLSRFGASDAVDYLKFVPEGHSDTVAQKLAANPRNMVGAWVEPIDGVDHVFMDVASVIRDRDTALRIGGALNEMGVYGFAERKTLYLRDFSDFLEGGANYTPDALRRFGFEDSVTVGVPEPARPAPRLELPRSLVRDEGGFAADIPGTRVRELAEEMAQRHFDSPRGVAALDPREIAATLEKLPEFAEFVRLYRAMVVDNMTGSLDRRSMRPGTLIEFAGLAGLDTPRWSRGRDASVSFPASLQGSLPQAIRDGAVNLGMRIRNMDVFANDDVYDPTFYVEFFRVINRVEDATGMPREVLASALASASSQAAPYDEMLRFARVAPMVRVRNGVAEPVPGAIEMLGSDTMAITALRGLIDTVNRPDFLTFKPAGQAMKTSSYAYARVDPLYIPTYVADTVDGLGQFLIKGVKPGLSNPQHSIVNQIAGRTLANLYEVRPGAVQEAWWSHIRVARDGIQLTQTGAPTQTAIAPAFTGSQGTAEEVLIAAIERMDKNVIRLARQNRDQFYAEVKAGKLKAWEWDAPNNRPVISSSEYLIPADKRLEMGGRAGILQAQMLRLVESLGPALRGRLSALAAVLGIPVTSLAAALGAAGAVLGGLQGSAEASDGEGVTLSAGAFGAGAAVGGISGAVVGGVAGLTTRALLKATRRFGRSRRLQAKDQIRNHEQEAPFVKDAIDDRRKSFFMRMEVAEGQTPSHPLAQDGQGLKGTPAARLSEDLRDTMYEMQQELLTKTGSTVRPNRLPGEDVSVPVNWMAKYAPEALRVVEGVLMRSVSGGRGSNVAYRVLGDGDILNGGALRGKYLVSSVTEDLFDTPLWSFNDTSLANHLGRRRLLQDFDMILRDIGPSIEHEPNPVLYVFNTAEPGYAGATSNRVTDFFEPWYLDYDKLPNRLVNANDERRMVITGGNLVDSREEAFVQAAQRGQKFVRNAMDGSLVEVPDKYLSGIAETVDGIVLPPLGKNRSIIPELDDAFFDRVNPIASTGYTGRGSGDQALGELYKVLKFDEPTVLIDGAQAERLIEKGYMPLFRGIDTAGLDQTLDQPWVLLRERLGGNTLDYVNVVESSPIVLDEYTRFVPEFMRDPNSPVYKSPVAYFQETSAAYVDYKKTFVRPPRWDTSVKADAENRARREKFMVEEFFDSQGINVKLRSKQDWVRNFATGEHYPGVGSHGNGTYMTPNVERAMGYAETTNVPQPAEGVVIATLLRPDARIMGPNEHQEFTRILRVMETRGLDGRDLTYAGNPMAKQMQGIVRYAGTNRRLSMDELARMADPSTSPEELLRLGVDVDDIVMHEVFMDHGRLIAALGYDGFIPHSTVYGYHKPEYVILNRKALLVIDQPVQPIEFTAGAWKLRD